MIISMHERGGAQSNEHRRYESMKTAIERLRTWDRRSQLHEQVDRNLRQAFGELDRLADKLNGLSERTRGGLSKF